MLVYVIILVLSMDSSPTGTCYANLRRHLLVPSMGNSPTGTCYASLRHRHCGVFHGQ